MTKREREAMQMLVNKGMEYREKSDKAFNRLQDLNATEGTGCRWCSAKHNMEDLHSVGKDYTGIYDEYIKYHAMYEALTMELGGELAELNFWK